MAKRRLVRPGAIGVCFLLALVLSSCIGGLPVTVNSVTGTLEPYNPATQSSGIPAEQVDFTVGDYTYGSSFLACLIDVRDHGEFVGSTIATIGPQAGTSVLGGVEESVGVDVSVPSPFDGHPSDATVNCVPGLP